MGRRGILFLDIAVKVALIALLLHAVANPDLPQYSGKAMVGRAVTFPIAAFLVPVVWWLGFRRRPYPAAVDLLFTAPFLIDVVGNALGLYDSIEWWDDANHYFNWMLLCAGVGMLLLRVALPPVVIAALTVGFGTFAAIVWELGEYMAFIRHSSELATAYTDTLGDLMLGTLGSITAAVAVGVVARRRVTRT